MKLFLVFFALFALIFLVAGDIVEKNIICVDEIKALEKCLHEAGEGQGWCSIGNTVISDMRKFKRFDLAKLLEIFFRRFSEGRRCLQGVDAENE